MENALFFLLRASPYFSRLVLLLAAGPLTRIALRSLLHPVATAAGNQTLLQSGLAVTMHQVAFGAFPLCVALLAAASLFSRDTLWAGLTAIATFALTALLVRLVAIHARGGLAQNIGPLIGESVMGLFCLSALALEMLRQR